MQIESVSNNLIKHAFNLHQKKYRDQHNQFLAQGIRLVADACLASLSLIERIFITQRCKADFDDFLKSNSHRFLNAGFNNANINDKLVFVADRVIKKLSLSDSAQEIIAIINKKEQIQPSDYVLYLDRIRDPGNLGSILRTAAAAGFGLILDNCADIYSPKVVQSSMSAILSVNYCHAGIEALKQLKTSGHTLVAADLLGENLFKASIKPPVCAIIGNEANGISNEILQLVDKTVTIPMQSTESLNASVSAGIVMYYIKQMCQN